jgi:hypothetical protein
MPVGRFTGYQPIPDMPGAYSFQTNGGPPLTFGGPDAEQLKARLDAANAQTMTADRFSAGGYGGENAPPTQDQIQSFRDQFTGGGAPPASIAREPAGAPAPQPGGALGYGLRVSPQGTIQKFAPGTRGVTTEQLKKADEGAVAMRRGETDVVQQGTPQDQEYLDARAEANIDQRLATQEQGDMAVAAAQDESRLAAEQFEQVKRLQAEEAARTADLERKFAMEEEAKNKAFADYTSSKVKPDRLFAHPLQGIGVALMQAAGAYASVMGKSPNYAQQILDQAVDRDIRAQEAAIRLKGDKANNLLSELRQRGMSVEQSRAAAKGIQVQYGAAQLSALRAKNAVPALENQYKNIDLALQKSLMEANEQSRLASIDKVTRQTSKGFEQPRAGSAGGWVDVGDQLGTAAKVQGLQKGEADIAKTQRDAAKGPTASPEKRQAVSALADASNLEKTLSKYEDDAVPPTTENRNVVGRAVEGALDYVGGKGTGARNTLSEQERRMNQDFADAQQTLGALSSVLGGQGALSGPERDAFMAGMAPGATMGEVKRAVAKLRSRAAAKLEGADAVGEAGGNVVTK